MVTDCDPVLLALESPGPETAQLVTSDALQEMVEVSPARTRVGFALMDASGERTATEAEADGDVPSELEQVIWKIDGFCVSAPDEALPEVAPPVENPPAAVQDVAWVELHVSVVDWPLSIVLGFADSVAAGTNEVQVGGLFAPLLHTKEPKGLEALPPVPVHPPLLQATHDELI